MNTIEEEEFDYQAYMKEHAPDPDKIHRGPEARQKRREAAIHNDCGAAYGEKGDYDRAIEEYTEAIELNPDLAIAYINRGAAYQCKGLFDRAIAEFTKAIELKPDFAIAYINRGAAHQYKGLFDHAIADFTKAIERKPDFAIAYYNRGIAWLCQREWKKAESDLTDAKVMGVNIIQGFHNDYASVPDFERRNRVKLPADLAAMLTLQQSGSPIGANLH